MYAGKAVDKYEKSKLLISVDNYSCYIRTEEATELACCIL